MDLHHMFYVSQGGTNDPDNLIALCSNCHGKHHLGIIPTESLRAWKMLLISINEHFDRRALDLLLTIEPDWIGVSGDGILQCAPLIAAKFVSFRHIEGDSNVPGGYMLMITEKGRRFLEAWRNGDERAALLATREEIAAEATPDDGS